MNQQEAAEVRMTRGAVIGFIAVTIAFIVMGIILGHDIKKNNRSINDLRVSKANISQLQKSNCTLKFALLKARLQTYNRAIKEGKTKDQARAAAKNLTTIIIGMDGEKYCPTPKKYIIEKKNRREK